MFVTDSPALRPRVVVVVPKYGRRIVQRNRLRRRLREAIRIEWLPKCLEQGVALDVLVRARPEAYETTFQQLTDEVRVIAEQLCSQSSS